MKFDTKLKLLIWETLNQINARNFEWLKNSNQKRFLMCTWASKLQNGESQPTMCSFELHRWTIQNKGLKHKHSSWWSAFTNCASKKGSKTLQTCLWIEKNHVHFKKIQRTWNPFSTMIRWKLRTNKCSKLLEIKERKKKIWKWCIDLIWLIGCETLHLRFCTAESIPSKCSHTKKRRPSYSGESERNWTNIGMFGFILFPTLSNFVYLGENLIEKIVGWLMELN